MAVDEGDLMPVPTREEIEERRLRKRELAAVDWQRRGGRCCSSCKAPVVFAKNANTGAFQIVDAAPNWEKGNITLSGQATHELQAHVHNVTDVASNRAAGVPYHTDHHATCPYADQHRRKP